MMEGSKGLLFALLLIEVLLLLWYASRSIKFTRHKKPLLLPQSLFMLVTGLPILMEAWVNIPLPILYVLYYFARYFGLKLCGNNKNNSYFFINITFIYVIAAHLCFLGCTALVAQIGLEQVLHNSSLRLVSLIFMLAINTGLDVLLMKWEKKTSFFAHYGQTGEFRLFMRFIWLCTCYVVVDSVLCLYPLPPWFTPLFLVGSNLLLLFLASLFFWHIYRLNQVDDLADENHRLKNAVQEQQNKAAHLRQSAYTDPLTGAYSRRYVLEHIGRMLEAGEPFALAYLDLDHLKQINDSQGHVAGDHYLQDFVTVFNQNLRNNDVFARIGGDEFLVVLPDLNQQQAHWQLEEIRRRLAGQQPPFAFSFGISSNMESNLTVEMLLQQADSAMYVDKRRER